MGGGAVVLGLEYIPGGEPCGEERIVAWRRCGCGSWPPIPSSSNAVTAAVATRLPPLSCVLSADAALREGGREAVQTLDGQRLPL